MDAQLAEDIQLKPSRKVKNAWTVVQVALWGAGLLLIYLLLFDPTIGIHALWNVLIPVAPALLIVAPGLWRNVCPLAFTGLLPRRFHLSAGKELSEAVNDRLLFGAVVLLFLTVPLRHVILDTSGVASAIALLTVGGLALVMGFFFERKSAWCSGLCPVHPVEKLYGSEPAPSFSNAHCESCERCVAVCPDSVPSVDPFTGSNGGWFRPAAGFLMLGAFPGFIWGWFQVPDFHGVEGWSNLGEIYGYPLLGAIVTLIAFLLLRGVLPRGKDKFLLRLFATLAISCYYWYRLPALFGVSPFGEDGGMLVDLTAFLPPSFAFYSRVLTTAFFCYWLLLRRSHPKSWVERPSFA